jgi:Flp pilus assembly pilin Flp
MHSIAALIRSHLSTRLRDDRGAALVEYVLLVALIAVVCVVSVAFLGTSLDGEFSRFGSEMP